MIGPVMRYPEDIRVISMTLILSHLFDGGVVGAGGT